MDPIALLIYFVIVAVVCGLFYFLIQKAPFIPAEFKGFALWGIIAIFVFAIVFKLMQFV